MIKKMWLLLLLLAVVCVWAVPIQNVYAADPIVIGVPTSIGFLEGKECLKAVEMAAEEINAKGGVNVGGKKRLLKMMNQAAIGTSPMGRKVRQDLLLQEPAR